MTEHIPTEKLLPDVYAKHGPIATVIALVTVLPFVLAGLAVGLVFAIPGIVLASVFSRPAAPPTE